MPTSVCCATLRPDSMTIAFLDINDSNLQLWHGEQVFQSPGYALLEGQQYRFGQPARNVARLRPRDINSRYWWQLNTKTLQPALGPARHTADLVHAHLLDIHKQAGCPEEMILAAPSSMHRDQVALLLGIIEQCPFEAVGLVNRSVALASQCSASGKLYHLEIQLHQAVISEVTSVNGFVELQDVFPLHGHGLLQLQEQLVEIIGRAFIHQTRFDPRRKADTEQQLYGHLPAVLLAIEETGEHHLDIEGYRARICHDDLQVVARSLLESATRIIGKSAPDDRVMLDPGVAVLPGFVEQFPHAERISDKALIEAVKHHQGRLVHRDTDLNFITSLPHQAPDSKSRVERMPEPDITPARSAAATHLLKGGHASPLPANGSTLDTGCELYLSDGNWQLRGEGLESVHVNGVIYSRGQILHSGDNISTATGTPVVLIEVTD